MRSSYAHSEHRIYAGHGRGRASGEEMHDPSLRVDCKPLARNPQKGQDMLWSAANSCSFKLKRWGLKQIRGNLTRRAFSCFFFFFFSDFPGALRLLRKYGEKLGKRQTNPGKHSKRSPPLLTSFFPQRVFFREGGGCMF